MPSDPRAKQNPESALRRRLGRPDHAFGNARGELLVWVPAPGQIIVSIGRGHGGIEFVGPYLAAADAAIAQGAREIWDDWSELTSYDTQSRVLVTKWTKARPAIMKDIHVLVGSRLVSMGVTVANLALGNAFEVTSDRAHFEARVLAKL